MHSHNQRSAQIDVESISQCIELYKKDNAGVHPINLQELVDRRYLKNYTTTPKDGWGNEYMFQDLGGTYRVYSYGADGKPGGKGEAEDIEVMGDTTK